MFFWVLCLGIGFAFLTREQFTPIVSSTPASLFPASPALHPDAGKATLIIFAHPFCPCTRASLHELDRMVNETGGRICPQIVFTIPNGLSHWEESDLVQYAGKISGAKIVIDRDGTESTRFGAQGSGETFLYDSSGRLIFHGGITPSRGHEGESAGRSAITNFVLHGQTPVQESPAFGCSLL